MHLNALGSSFHLQKRGEGYQELAVAYIADRPVPGVMCLRIEVSLSVMMAVLYEYLMN